MNAFVKSRILPGVAAVCVAGMALFAPITEADARKSPGEVKAPSAGIRPAASGSATAKKLACSGSHCAPSTGTSQAKPNPVDAIIRDHRKPGYCHQGHCKQERPHYIVRPR